MSRDPGIFAAIDVSADVGRGGAVPVRGGTAIYRGPPR